MITHILIDFFSDEGIKERSRLINVKEPVPHKTQRSEHLKDFYIKVDGISGHTSIIKEEQLCALCKGTGGVQYWYAQDHSVRANCPVCNEGNQEEWNKKKADWEKFQQGG